jgi:glycosyltransferase involved in cell wall biosynthesis
MSLPDIAIVIPTYNRRDVLPTAIDSVLEQEHENLELIVVDDCSTDDTASYLRSITDTRIKWHRFSERRRGNAARNHGVRLSRAQLLSFLDSDDFYKPSRIADVLAVFKERPDVGAHISSFLSKTQSALTPCANPDAVFSREEFEQYLVAYCLFIGGSGITIKRGVFEEIGGFDESISRMQDRDLLLRLARVRGCATTSKINWVKNRSADSLSHQSAGQLTALNALCCRHPIIESRYPKLLRYLVAREIVQPLLNLRISEALNALREARQNERSYVRVRDLPAHYIPGKRLRRRLRKQLSPRSRTDSASPI